MEGICLAAARCRFAAVKWLSFTLWARHLAGRARFAGTQHTGAAMRGRLPRARSVHGGQAIVLIRETLTRGAGAKLLGQMA